MIWKSVLKMQKFAVCKWTCIQSFAISTQQPIYESYDLEKREQLIIKYLNKNPGSTKEQVVDGLKNDYSRIPVLNSINKLLEKGLIIKALFT